MQTLTLTLFGAAAASLDDQPIRFRTDKIRALLFYLALESDRPHERQALAGLLWPEQPETTALKNLRGSLHRLQASLDEGRPGLSETLFRVTRRTIQFNPHTSGIDARSFLDLLSACETHPHRHLHLCRECLDRLTRATELYRGELLAGFGLSDAYPFEEWLLYWRERFQAQVVSALGQLAGALAERGEVETAIGRAVRLATLDPFREDAHRLLMRLYARSGDHARAFAQYETCRKLLEAELGVDPAAETTALYRQILAEQRGEITSEAAEARPSPLHNFPAQFNPFVGRERELEAVQEWFLEPGARLLTLTGPGGVGKTRLAQRAGELLAARGGFRDGVYFFPLASVRTGEALLTSLMNGLGAVASARVSLQESLANHLRDRQCLLVLDNFEQLVESAALLGQLLEAAPGLRLLAASQVLLELQAERRLAVGGLDVPEQEVAAAEALSFSAVRLFVESARRSDPAFRLDAENVRAVLQICRLVEGLPLALELAASWIRAMEPGAIAQEIGQGLDFLSLSTRDRPGRHQSLAAVFRHAWDLLPRTEQLVLNQLGVFRGPFDLDAAMAVTDATALSIARLLDRSLLQRRKDGLYELHGFLRRFAEQQSAGRGQEAARRHADYFLDLVAAQEKALYGPQPRLAVAAVRGYLGNVRQAWRWAVENEHRSAVERSQEAIGRFYLVAALIEEGEAVFRQASAAFEGSARLATWHAYFLFRRGDLAEAARLAESALESAGADENARAEALSLLGEMLPRLGEHERAKALQRQAIETFQAGSDLERLARALRRMAVACSRAGEQEETIRYFRRAVPIHQAIGEKRGLALLYNVAAAVYFERDDLQNALDHVERAQELYEEIEERLDASVVAGNLARLYTQLGRYDEALAANKKALETSRDLGDRPSLARDLAHQGQILATLGDFTGGLDHYFQAIELARAQNDAMRVADFQAGAAAVHALEGDDESALAYYDLALPVLLAQGNPYHLAGSLLGKAELLYRQGEWAESRALCRQAADLAEEAQLSEYRLRARVLAARLDHAGGSPDAGLRKLADLIDEAQEEPDRAALHYEIWQLTRDRSAGRAALTGYRHTAGQSPSYVNKRRLAELEAYFEARPLT